MFSHTFPFVPDNPFSFWQTLHKNPQTGFVLGSGAATENDHVMYMSVEEPTQAWGAGSVFKKDPLQKLKQKFKDERDTMGSFPRFVGFVGFEAGRTFDPGIRRLEEKPPSLKLPIVSFAEYKAVLKLDFLKQETTLAVFDPQSIAKAKTLVEKIKRTWVSEIKKPLCSQVEKKGASSSSFQEEFFFEDMDSFARKVEKTKNAIKEGDIYQANISVQFSRSFSGNPVALYENVCKKNPSPYACLLKQSSFWIVSCSPELLLKVEGEDVSTRPIAGTRPRGDSSQADRAEAGRLLLSPKERAEHIMLVDLARNDLGRVCRPGSVRVAESYVIERYSHVMHIVSDVRGRMMKRKDALDALRAVFPGGTITGCPKIKSIEIISNIEGEAREPFFGSAGYLAWNGDTKFNILIRTAVIKNNKIMIRAGAGIVADSQPKREYREVLAKAQVLLESVIETER